MKRGMTVVFLTSTALVLVLIFMICLPAQESVNAQDQASIVVNTLDDEDNSDGDCSLREAVKAASNNAAADACPAGSTLTDEITFSVEGTIELDNQLLVMPSDPLVLSAGDAITLDGGGEVHILTVFEGANLTLEDISLVNGYSGGYGGAIYNLGTLTILSSSLTGNLVADGNGGAIYNTGNLRIEDSDFSDNEAFWEGGAVYNASGASLNVSVTSFSGNQSGSGGSISNDGVLNVSNSNLTSSLARAGGGIVNTSILTVTNSTISENVAYDPGIGGGDFDGNGAGIIAFEGMVYISNTTLYANQAEGEGAGIFINHGSLTIENSTFSANQAVRWGGAINSWNIDLVTINHSTFFSNTAGWDGGSIYGGHSTFQIKNSIIAGSPGACDCFDAPCEGYFIDQGHNIEDTNACFFSAANGSLPETDPQLMPLGDNGGPTLTHALMPTSLAIDAIDPAGCTSTDQRGVARPIDGDVDGNAWCDIGSYEYQLPTTTTISGDDPDPSLEGEPFTVAFEVESSYGMPTGEVMVTVSGSEEDCTGTLSDGNGSCTLTLDEAGVYMLTATYLGAGELGRSSDETGHIVDSNLVDFYLPVIFK